MEKESAVVGDRETSRRGGVEKESAVVGDQRDKKERRDVEGHYSCRRSEG